ncbi:dihydrolipoyllysine-residue acetyltransferase component of pyruvate dehydrogenase complex, mitochondrial isoform X4 [Drosophila grimshawi]|uniref:dihydrolipoyllysine-residue acetyltransferase component of pyruvate dehydrogenase complex, mitochondrial isoform X4 n=1 Tax=Drosophila grimshawi TaxID=7222 RepID=UPI000C86EF7E|nr:dihydrolipoyllysine-residue acetyltransferase component of pyruvate dehydrogenase complex, mitochondrial isoform X4 [Drosophila grimshawi]
MLRSLSATRHELGALRAVFLRSQVSRRGFNGGFRALSSQRCLLGIRTTPNGIPILSRPQILSTWNCNFARAYANLPDHIRVPLPALSPTMDRGSIVSWEKKEGDKLNEGDLLCEIETDKATMGFETPEEGYLAKILVPGGSRDVPVGKLVCIIVPDEGSIAAFADFKDDSPAGAPAPAAAAAAPPPPPPVAVPVAAPVAAAPEPPPAAAPASQAAEQPLAHPPAAAPGARFKDIPLTTMRSVIAKRLLESKQNLPHYYVTVQCQIDKLMEFRAHVNKKYEKEGARVSINDFIIKAIGIASRKVPEANSSWMNTFIREYDDVDVSVAVSTDKGLITPIVFGADRKGVLEISRNVKELAGKARANKLQPQEFQGGTISVSNLGMFGVNQFCAVINPPQSCILAIGTTTKSLVLAPDSPQGFKEVNMLTVTLSADHRVVDGAVAAVWLKHFRDFMEDPQTMIL